MRNKTIIAISAILSIGAFFILPVYDDFYYLSSPHKMMDVESFLPNGSFWRPIDALWGIMMGKLLNIVTFFVHATNLLKIDLHKISYIFVLLCVLNGIAMSFFIQTFSAQSKRTRFERQKDYILITSLKYTKSTKH